MKLGDVSPWNWLLERSTVGAVGPAQSAFPSQGSVIDGLSLSLPLWMKKSPTVGAGRRRIISGVPWEGHMVGQIIIMKRVRKGHRCSRPGKAQIWTSSLPKTHGIRQCYAEQSVSRAFPGFIHWAQELFKDSATFNLKKVSAQKCKSVVNHVYHKSPS